MKFIHDSEEKIRSPAIGTLKYTQSFGKYVQNPLRRKEKEKENIFVFFLKYVNQYSRSCSENISPKSYKLNETEKKNDQCRNNQ